MPTAIVLCGPPGSGKTTFRNAYLNDYKTASTDDIILQLCGMTGRSYNEVWKEIINDADQMFWFDVFSNSANDLDFVIDRTNLTVKSRARTLKALPEYYNKVAVYFPALPFSELRARITARAAINTQDIPNSVIMSMREAWTIPTTEEGWNSVWSAEDFIGIIK